MISLNETIVALDLAQALEGESGKFEVTAPDGSRYVAVCLPTHSLANFRPLTENAHPQPWRIRKVAEFRSGEETVK